MNGLFDLCRFEYHLEYDGSPPVNCSSSVP
jgi:hypothetical protein